MSEILKPAPPEIKEIPGILRIGVDIDGVVANIKPVVRKMVLEKLGVDLDSVSKGKDAIEYWLHEWPEIKSIPRGPKFVLDMWGNPAVFEGAEQIPGAVEILNEWHRIGYQISFITARVKPLVGEATLCWMRKNGLGWAGENNVFFPQFSNEDRRIFKSEVVKKLSLHAFIEDHAETLRMTSSASMMVKILLKYPYNINEDAGTQVKRANTWEEIGEIIQETSRWHHFLHS